MSPAAGHRHGRAERGPFGPQRPFGPAFVRRPMFQISALPPIFRDLRPPGYLDKQRRSGTWDITTTPDTRSQFCTQWLLASSCAGVAKIVLSLSSSKRAALTLGCLGSSETSAAGFQTLLFVRSACRRCCCSYPLLAPDTASNAAPRSGRVQHTILNGGRYIERNTRICMYLVVFQMHGLMAFLVQTQGHIAFLVKTSGGMAFLLEYSKP